MDDRAIGRLFRELRLRLGWRASDVALRAGISTSTYSRVERGHFDRVKLSTLRQVGAVLEVRLVLEGRWRGAAADRILSSRHTQMTESVVQMLTAAGWEVRPEVSFNHFGERGVVDIVGWHAAFRTVLLVELKTELVVLNQLLTVADRRRRLATVITEPFGWRPTHVGQWVVLAPSRTNERRVAEARSAMRAVFPSDGRSISGWLRRPDRPASALWFLPNFDGVGRRRDVAPRQRVRLRTSNVAGPEKAA